MMLNKKLIQWFWFDVTTKPHFIKVQYIYFFKWKIIFAFGMAQADPSKVQFGFKYDSPAWMIFTLILLSGYGRG